MFEQLVTIICNYVEVEPENVHPESRFMEDLGFTSFDFMSMLGEVEDEFDIEIDEHEAANIRTVGEAVEYLEKLQAKLLQLKDLSESLFQYSLTGEETDLEIDPPASFEQVFFYPLNDMAAYLEQHGFTFVFPETWPACRVTVYAPYIRRIIDNLASSLGISSLQRYQRLRVF